MITITTPAGPQSLVSLSVLKEELGVVGTTDDALFTRWIAQESARIASALGRPDELGLATLTETIRLPGSNSAFHGDSWFSSQNYAPARPIVLERYPIVSVISITLDGVLIDPSGYDLDGSRVYKTYSGCRVPWFGLSVTIVYTAGYDLPDNAPFDLAGACIQLVSARKAGRGRDPGVRRERVDGVGETVWHDPTIVEGIPGGMTEEVWNSIASYRSPLVT